MWGAVIATLFCVILFILLKSVDTPSFTGDVKVVVISGRSINVEVADTEEKRALGLSGRSGLGRDEGMLFVFTEDARHSFWMKDMLFAIDIIWLSRDGVVIDIAPSVSPDTYPTSFSPEAPARYALELRAGFIKEYTVKKGDAVLFK